MEFSDANRDLCAARGIDIEDSYKRMLVEIRVGGNLVERINHEMSGLRSSNHFDYDATIATLGQPSAPARKRERQHSLTPAEKRVLTAMAAGQTTVEHGESIWRSRHTIRDQVKSARRKLGARNTTHAVAIAIRAGLIQPPPAT